MFTTIPFTKSIQRRSTPILLASLVCLCIPCIAKESKPRVAELVYGNNNLVPVISYDVAAD